MGKKKRSVPVELGQQVIVELHVDTSCSRNGIFFQSGVVQAIDPKEWPDHAYIHFSHLPPGLGAWFPMDRLFVSAA